MPATNMAVDPADLANPDTGTTVLMSPFSGPTGSPLDTDVSGSFSTGALNTGIGFGLNHVIGITAPASIVAAGFTDDYTPGVTMPDGTAATLAVLTAIGGGKSDAASNGVAATNPYAVQPLLSFGNGIERDAGAGPAFTGHAIKTVTAVGTVADDGVVETGFTNQSGVTIVAGQAVFGSETADSAAIS